MEGFKYQIGDTLMHRSSLVLLSGDLRILPPVVFFVTGKVMEESPAGMTRSYLCRIVITGTVSTAYGTFLEEELCPIPAATEPPAA